MSRFPEELKVIPGVAWGIAVLTGVGFAMCLQLAALPNDPKLAHWPLMFQLCFSVLMGLILFVYAVLIGYVNGDARRRGMRSGMWTLLAVFIPNGIGVILYFILRDPLPQTCRKCGITVRAKGTFCPACGTALGYSCPSCHRPLEPGWSHCAGCGAEIKHV